MRSARSTARASRVAVLLPLVALACSPVYSRTPMLKATPEPPSPLPTALEEVLPSLIWPLAVDGASVVSSGYGVRSHPLGGNQRFHGGVDLSALEGSPVHAIADGVVAHSDREGAYGNLVIVDHGAELGSLYGHHQRNLVREGERVRRGQVIALVGHTGNATGSHLHFELRWRGGTVDPELVLPRLARSR